MPHAAHRVRLEGVDFATAFPTLRLFDSFRMALQPTKLLLALLMLILVYFGGLIFQFIWGPQTPEVGEVYWIFDRVLSDELAAFGHLVTSAVNLNLGLGTITHRSPQGVVGALYAMVVVIPTWLWKTHPWFFVVMVLDAAIIKLVLGGAIARLAAVQACLGRNASLNETARFTWSMAFWLVVAPLIPLVVAGVIWLVLALGGGVLFNIPGLNVVGGVLFGVMLFAGLVGACVLLFTALGSGLLPSALAVEGTDAFDAVSRVFAFLIYRPMRFFFLTAVMVVYGALTYILVGLVVFLALWFTRAAAGVWASELHSYMPAPELSEFPTGAEVSDLSATGKATAWLVGAWTKLLFGVSVAYATSYFFTAQTWVYLLLRKAVDDSAFDECYVEEGANLLAAPSEKIEPVSSSESTPPAAEPDASA